MPRSTVAPTAGTRTLTVTRAWSRQRCGPSSSTHWRPPTEIRSLRNGKTVVYSYGCAGSHASLVNDCCSEKESFSWPAVRCSHSGSGFLM